jgi:hypothetical protein
MAVAATVVVGVTVAGAAALVAVGEDLVLDGAIRSDFTHLHPTAQHLDLVHVDLMDASVHLTTHTLFRLS